jgi:hypothetical protein
VFGDAATARHKFDVLGEHCEPEGRDYDAIEKTVYYVVDVGRGGDRAGEVVEQLGTLAEAGVQAAIGALRGVEDPATIEAVGHKVISQIGDL